MCFLGEAQIPAPLHQAGAGRAGEHVMDCPVAFLCHHVTPPLHVSLPFSQKRRLAVFCQGHSEAASLELAESGGGTARQWTLGKRRWKSKKTSVYCKVV